MLLSYTMGIKNYIISLIYSLLDLGINFLLRLDHHLKDNRNFNNVIRVKVSFAFKNIYSSYYSFY